MGERRAFLVVGEANSGNRMMRRAFMAAGCHGDTERCIHVEDLQAGGLPDRIVLVRSGPNEDGFDFKILAGHCQAAGYAVTPVLIYRKTDFALAGHRQHYGLTHRQAVRQRNEVTRLMYELAAWLRTPLVVIPYEPFVGDRSVRRALFRSLGLREPAMEFYNANEGYRLAGPPLPF